MFDVNDIYPSIKDILFYQVLQFTKMHVNITQKDIEVMFYSKKGFYVTDKYHGLKRRNLMLLWEFILAQKSVNLKYLCCHLQGENNSKHQ